MCVNRTDALPIPNDGVCRSPDRGDSCSDCLYDAADPLLIIGACTAAAAIAYSLTCSTCGTCFAGSGGCGGICGAFCVLAGCTCASAGAGVTAIACCTAKGGCDGCFPCLGVKEAEESEELLGWGRPVAEVPGLLMQQEAVWAVPVLEQQQQQQQPLLVEQQQHQLLLTNPTLPENHLSFPALVAPEGEHA